jgi:CBS domain-containing protein
MLPPEHRRRARRLRDRADRWWDEHQLAHLRGDHERAEDLERYARRLEERADLREAMAWQPKIDVAPLTPAERARLREIFAELIEERARWNAAVRARRARTADRPRSPAFYETALRLEADLVRAAPVGNRDNQLAASAWSLAKYYCEGSITEGDILEALIPAALATGLGSRQAHVTVRGVLRRRCGGAAA